jgi:peptidylprolyl isomerase
MRTARRSRAPGELAVKYALIATVLLSAIPSLARSDDEINPDKMTKTDSGLKYKEVKEGTGPKPETGQKCKVHYTGWLWVDGKKGREFDSSFDRNEPFTFDIGKKQVIKGWDEGVSTMKTGGKRLLLIPPDLAYGPKGVGGVIPANSTLLFEVELIEVK